jgi:hypothetical protein
LHQSNESRKWSQPSLFGVYLFLRSLSKLLILVYCCGAGKQLTATGMRTICTEKSLSPIMNALPLETGGNTYLYNFSKYHIAVKSRRRSNKQQFKMF